MYTRFAISAIAIIIGLGIISAKDSLEYTYTECLGSAMPYPTDLPQISYPDSLVPVMINHVGRHGARYDASIAPMDAIKHALLKAQQLHTITRLGTDLLYLIDSEIDLNEGHWGELDSLGMAEQCGIAKRMYHNFTEVFDSCHLYALSSYVPRAMMSMYVFNHQLDLLDNDIEFVSSSGRVNSPLMRPFDLSRPYHEYRHSAVLADVYREYFDRTCPVSAIRRVLGADYPFSDMQEMRDLAYDEYKALNGLLAMSMPCDISLYLTITEVNALWRCFNLRQYLDYSSSVLSTAPADLAILLLDDIIDATDRYISGVSDCNVSLRFGHAETLMPLLALMRLPGCYYVTPDFDEIARRWRDFDIVPMAANLQLVLFKSSNSGHYYLMTLLNEVPVSLIPGQQPIVPWLEARHYLTHDILRRPPAE